mgnify:CR=1 FL=1
MVSLIVYWGRKTPEYNWRYNYLAIDDDVWVYTGVTSITGDQSNVGFVLMNQRTMETKFYEVEGATEASAMSSEKDRYRT